MKNTNNKNEFEKLLFEIVEDLKTIHLGFINNKHHKVEIYPKILKLLDIFDVPEYYNLENAKTLQSLYLTCNVVFLSISNFPESPNYSFYCENNKYIIFIHRFTVFLNIHKLYREVNKRIIAADFNILDLINEINVFNNKKEVKSFKPIQFKDIFIAPYNSDKKINELKKILRTKGYTDNNDKWIKKELANKKELASLYWLFSEKNIINTSYNKTLLLKTFYNEFGLIVYTDYETKPENSYTSYKNICNNERGVAYDTFEKLFLDWISKV